MMDFNKWKSHVDPSKFWVNILVSQQVSNKFIEFGIGEVITAGGNSSFLFRDDFQYDLSGDEMTGILEKEGFLPVVDDPDNLKILDRSIPLRLIMNQQTLLRLIHIGVSCVVKDVFANRHKDVFEVLGGKDHDLSNIFSKLRI